MFPIAHHTSGIRGGAPDSLRLAIGLSNFFFRLPTAQAYSNYQVLIPNYNQGVLAGNGHSDANGHDHATNFNTDANTNRHTNATGPQRRSSTLSAAGN